MAEARGFRWTALRVATLYPVGLPLLLVYVALGEVLLFTGTVRNFPHVSVLLGYLGAGAAALVLTRSLSLDLSAWAVALAAYAVGGAVAAASFGLIQLCKRGD